MGGSINCYQILFYETLVEMNSNKKTGDTLRVSPVVSFLKPILVLVLHHLHQLIQRIGLHFGFHREGFAGGVDLERFHQGG